MSSNSTLLGVVVLARHGDRQGFYQDPLTYDSSNTAITPLGNAEEFQLGQLLRSLYFTPNSSLLIPGISTDLFDQNQVQLSADAGDEGFVIYDSAISLTAGLWPATTSYNTTLANGTTIVAPLGGYQTVYVESVELDQSVSLEGFADCNPFTVSNEEFYNSSAFQQVASENAAFLNSLPPYLDGRPVSLENMFNIFDFMNVQSIHNATFANSLPAGYLEQARALANYHEYGVFSSPQLDGIGNIAGRTILPSIFEGIEDIANSSTGIKFVYTAISYKPFLSLFNMTGVAETYPQLASIVNYAAATVFEVYNGSTSDDPIVRFRFKNGTDDTDFTTYNMFGQSGDVSLSFFKSKLESATINTTAEWCQVCQNTQDRGCGELAAAAASAVAAHHQPLSPAAAGVVGAAVTLAVLLGTMALLSFCGLVSLGRRERRRSLQSAGKQQEEKS